MIQIYHNPRCGKSRNAVSYIEQQEIEFEIIKYLDNPPSYETLLKIIEMLNFKPIELVRQKEQIWIDEYKNKTLTDNQIITAMITHPILIERPIIIKDDKAIIGREIDKIASLF
jgi:arsenate reductase